MRETERNDGRNGRGRRRRAAAQGGSSLMEVLIAVFLVGTVILALAVGMLTMMRSTRAVSEQQRLEAAVLSYSEWLRAQEYVPCAGTDAYGAWTGLPGVEGEIEAIRHWKHGSGDTWTSDGFDASCTADLGRQLVDLTVELVNGPVITAQVVLRDDA